MTRQRTPTSQTRLAKLRASLKASTAAMILAGLAAFAIIISNSYLRQSTEIRTPATQTTPLVLPTDSKPYLTTSSLPDGKKGAKYQAYLEALSPDPNDKLTLTATDLPDGLYLTNCRSRPTNNQTLLSCKLTGKPSEKGTFYPTFILTDTHENIIRPMLTVNIY